MLHVCVALLRFIIKVEQFQTSVVVRQAETVRNFHGKIVSETLEHRRNNCRDMGRLVKQPKSWGPTMYCPQLLGRSFHKARNFTASSHQNAGFSIWVFFKFLRGWYPRTLTPNTQSDLWPGAGRKLPVLGPKPWSP